MAVPAETIIVWSSALLTFLLFSFSKFQLPHYILVVFPQFSILTALCLLRLKGRSLNVFFIVQNVIFAIVVALLSLIAVCFRFPLYGLAIAMLLAIFVAAFLIFKGRVLRTIIGRNVMLSMGIMLFLYLFFYPALSKYQAGMQAGKWLIENKITARPTVFRYNQSFSFDFYANGEVRYLYSDADLEKAVREKNLVIYTPEAELEGLKSKYRLQILKSFDYYRITKLKAKFIWADSRPTVLERFYLVKIY